MEILQITYKSTHYYFPDTSNGLLAFDTGWPGTYREYKEELKKAGCKIRDIQWLVVSHFHIDHAGLAGFLLDCGKEINTALAYWCELPGFSFQGWG